MATQVENMAEGAKQIGGQVQNALSSVKKNGVEPGDAKEGTVTKQIESFTSQVSSGTFLGLALGSIALSAICQMAGQKQNAQFIGQWVPTILIMGLYNKLVKVHGSEA